MDLQFLWMLLKIVIFLPFVLFLIYASLKFGGNRLQSIQSGRYIKILERSAISKENSILVVKIGEKGYIMASTNGKLEILSELEKEELLKVEALKLIPQYDNLKDFYEKSGVKNLCKRYPLKDFYNKITSKKDGADEKEK